MHEPPRDSASGQAGDVWAAPPGSSEPGLRHAEDRTDVREVLGPTAPPAFARSAKGEVVVLDTDVSPTDPVPPVPSDPTA